MVCSMPTPVAPSTAVCTPLGPAAAPHHPVRTGSVVLLAWVAGCALQLQQPALWHGSVYGVGGVIAVVMVVLYLYLQRTANPAVGHTAWHGWLPVMAAVLLGGAITGGRAVWQQQTRMDPAWEGRDVWVQAVIAGLPQRLERGQRLVLAVERAHDASPDGAAISVPPRISVVWYEAGTGDGAERAAPATPSTPALHAGQRWQWVLRLKAPHAVRNPHGRDGELWLWNQGIQATGYVRQGPQVAPPQYVGTTWQAPMAQWRGHVRERMWAAQQLPDAAPQQGDWPWPRATPAAAGVVTALVTGDQAAIGPAQWQLFRDTGVAHLVSISGLHITMFAWLAVAVVGALWRRSARLCLWCPAPLAAGVAGLGLAAVYALFSGWGIPAQRTLGMLALVVLLRAQGRRWPWPYVWLCILAAVVAWNPWSLLQPGFWLSFVAVGVLFAAQPLQRGGASARWQWRAALGQLLREQAVVGLALAPLTVLLFGQLSVVGFVANLWAIPWVTLVVTPLAMLGALWSPLWGLAAWCVQGMLVLLQAMVQWPGAVAYFPQAPLWAGIAALVGAVWCALPWPWRLRSVGLPLLLPLLWWTPPRPAHGHFELWALDVGQGSAVLLRTAQHSLLVDAGPRWSEHADAGERTVVPLLRALGERLDGVLITHADSDHVGGAAAVLAAQPQAWWMGSGVEALRDGQGRSPQPCVAGQQWQWDGVRLQVLHPPPADHAVGAARNAANARSCVLRVASLSGAAALLLGDIEAAQEQQLLQQGAPLQAQAVVVAHHGSRTSSTPAFVAAVSPQVALVQSGYRNRFGHPAPSVVARWQAQGAAVYDSPRCGAALWRSDHPGQVVCERQARQRYWQHAADP